MIFSEPIWLLLLLPLGAWFFLRSGARNTAGRYGAAAAAFLILALANPMFVWRDQYGTVLVLVDHSSSVGAAGAQALEEQLQLIRKSKPAGEPFKYDMTIRAGKNAFIFMGFIFLYYAGFKLLGYWVTTPIFLILTQKYLRVKSWKLNLLITISYIVITFIIFVVILKLPIYKIGLFGKYFRIV